MMAKDKKKDEKDKKSQGSSPSKSKTNWLSFSTSFTEHERRLIRSAPSRQFNMTCPLCTGSGVVPSASTTTSARSSTPLDAAESAELK